MPLWGVVLLSLPFSHHQFSHHSFQQLHLQLIAWHCCQAAWPEQQRVLVQAQSKLQATLGLCNLSKGLEPCQLLAPWKGYRAQVPFSRLQTSEPASRAIQSWFCRVCMSQRWWVQWLGWTTSSRMTHIYGLCKIGHSCQ